MSKDEGMKPRTGKPRGRKKKKQALGAKNKPFKLHDYLHPSSGFQISGGGGG